MSDTNEFSLCFKCARGISWRKNGLHHYHCLRGLELSLLCEPFYRNDGRRERAKRRHRDWSSKGPTSDHAVVVNGENNGRT